MEVMRLGEERGQHCVEVGDRMSELVEVVTYLGARIGGEGRMEYRSRGD